MRRLLAALTLALAAGCPATEEVSIPCRTNANCPSGFGCGDKGVCVKGAAGTSGAKIAVTPGIANVPVGQTQRFVAVFDGAEGTAVWSVEGEGAIATDGTYTAPPAIPVSGQALIRATSPVDSAASGTAIALIVAKNPVPTLTSISPTEAVAGGADVEVTLDGSGFVSTSEMLLDQVAIGATSVTATRLKAMLPASGIPAGGVVAIRVRNPEPGGGTSAPQTFTVMNPVPVVSVLAPSSVPVGAPATVVASGSGFNPVTIARIGATSLVVTSRSAGSLTVDVPATLVATAGNVDLVVENPAPGGGSDSITLAVASPVPAVTSLNPSQVAAGTGPLTLRVTGTGFAPTSVVVAGTTDLVTTRVSAAELDAVLTAGLLASAGTVNVTVRTPAPGGGTSSALPITVGNPAPVVLSLAPADVLVATAPNGSQLEVNGTGFVQGATVRWDGTALSTTFWSPTRLLAAWPSPTFPDAAEIAVTAVNPSPGGGTSNAQTFTVKNPVPVVGSASPAGAIAGSAAMTLDVGGSGFVDTTEVVLDGAALATTFVSPNALRATVPATALAVGKVASLAARTPAPGGGMSGSRDWTISNLQAKTGSVSPMRAVAGTGPLDVTITGEFVPGVAVLFDGAALSATTTGPGQLRATIPASMLARSKTALVSLSNPPPGGGATLSTVYFQVDVSIRTFAGGFRGDGGPATDAALTRIFRFAVSPSGELYYSEPERHRIMRVDASGNVRQVGGKGFCASSGDGGPVSLAGICYPQALAFDASGRMFIAEEWANRVRLVEADGTIRTVAGNGRNDLNDGIGDGGPAIQAVVGDPYDVRLDASGLVYVACGGGPAGERIRRFAVDGSIETVAGNGSVGPPNGENIDARTAQFYYPQSIALDANDVLYIADYYNCRIRKVEGGLISTVYGTGATGPGAPGTNATTSPIGYPGYLWFEPGGSLLVAAPEHARILRIATDGIISIVAGNATATSGPLSADGVQASGATIGRPFAIVPDGNGNLLFATVHDSGGGEYSAIKKIDAVGVLTTVVGGHPTLAPAAQMFLHFPYAVAVDGVGNVFVTVREADRIFKVDVSGATTLVAGNGIRGYAGDSGQATAAQLCTPEGIWLDPDGTVFFTESGGMQRVRKIDPSGVISTVAGGGNLAAGCTYGAAGSPTSPPSGAGPNYNCIGDDYLPTQAALRNPRGVLRKGNYLYVSEYEEAYGGRIRRVDLVGSNPRITTIAGSTAVNTPCATEEAPVGGDFGDGGPATAARLCGPSGMAIDPNGDLIFADSSHRRLRKINLTTGTISRYAGTGRQGVTGDREPALVATFSRPWGLVFDVSGGLFVSDIETMVIRRIDALGFIFPVAGTAWVQGFAGDGGAATDAKFWTPTGIALGPDQAILYVAEVYNERIRQIGP